MMGDLCAEMAGRRAWVSRRAWVKNEAVEIFLLGDFQRSAALRRCLSVKGVRLASLLVVQRNGGG
jgi:hypothetical protein